MAACTTVIDVRNLEGVSFDALVQHQAEVAELIRRDPDVRSVTSSVGTTAAANQGQITIDLKPIVERKRSAEAIARDLMKATASVSDITTYIQNPPAISIGGLSSKSLYQYTLQSGDMAALNVAAREMERRMSAFGGDWSQVTATQLYTVHDIYPFIESELGKRGIFGQGLTWYLNRPPVQDLEYEMDCRRVHVERVIEG